MNVVALLGIVTRLAVEGDAGTTWKPVDAATIASGRCPATSYVHSDTLKLTVEAGDTQSVRASCTMSCRPGPQTGSLSSKAKATAPWSEAETAYALAAPVRGAPEFLLSSSTCSREDV